MVGERLGKAVEAYNKSTTTLESRVLVSARRLRDLKVGAGDGEIVELEQIEKVPRMLQAAEIAETGAGGAVSEANASAPAPSINYSREAAISS